MEMTPGQAGRGGTPRLQASQPSRAESRTAASAGAAGSRPSGTASGAVPVVMAMSDAAGPRPVTVSPQDAPRHAGQVVRRVLLRRNIVIDAETAQLVAAAVQAALQAGAPSRPRRGPRVPAADCEPLF